VNDELFLFKLIAGIVSMFCILGVLKSNRFLLNTITFLDERNINIKKYFFILGLVLIFTGLWEFNNKGKPTIAKINNKDVFFILDFTASMRVPDISGVTRLNIAIENIIDSLDSLNTSRIGLSIFSDMEYQLIPLTTDKEFFKQSLLSLQQNVIPSGGADIVNAFEGLFLREKDNLDLIAVVVSDFENIGVNPKIVQKYEGITEILAVGVGSTHGGKIPVVKRNKYQRNSYVKKNGKLIYSYFDTDSFNAFSNKLMLPGNISTFINSSIITNPNSKKKSEWLPPSVYPRGHILVFLGLFSLFISRFFILFNAYCVVFCILSNVFSMQVLMAQDLSQSESIILSGRGEHIDFVTFGNELAKTENFSAALKIYKEIEPSLSDIERINLGSLYFMNKQRTLGLKEYVNFLESHSPSSEHYNVVLNNLHLLLKQNGSSSSGGKTGNEQSKDSGGSAKGGSGNGLQKKSKEKGNSGLSNNDVLDKVKSDDMVNQGEYIRKKIQSNKFKNEVRW
jgi:hypothetical protein